MGSTTIKTICPICGQVTLTPDRIELFLDESDYSGYYIFVCPRCGLKVRKPADLRAVPLLIAAGVRRGKVSVDTAHPRNSGLPSLDYDDLLDFGRLLCPGGEARFENWLMRLHAQTQPRG